MFLNDLNNMPLNELVSNFRRIRRTSCKHRNLLRQRCFDNNLPKNFRANVLENTTGRILLMVHSVLDN